MSERMVNFIDCHANRLLDRCVVFGLFLGKNEQVESRRRDFLRRTVIAHDEHMRGAKLSERINWAMPDNELRELREVLGGLRSWQSALRQLADTLAPSADVEIDPMDPEVSCARIAEAVERRIHDAQREGRLEGAGVLCLEADLKSAEWSEECPHGVPYRYYCEDCDGLPIG